MYMVDVICVPRFWLSVAFVLVDCLYLCGDLRFFRHLVWLWVVSGSEEEILPAADPF